MKQYYKDFLKSIAPAVSFDRQQMLEMLAAENHSEDVRRHRASVIISRVQVVSAVFALLVPVWGIIDVIIFDWPINGLLVTARVVSGIIFLALAWPWDTVRTMGLAYVMLAVMLAIPPFFYLAAMPMFDGAELTRSQQLMAQAYALLPFVVVAGLSVFPLTALEGIAHSMPVFAITAVTAGQASGFNFETYVSNIWLMLLIIGVSLLSGMSQLHYIITLVNRASLDPLTGAHTRRSGTETFDLQYRLAEMQASNCALAFIDIDNFKSINDTYGHDEGDRVLKSLSAALKAHLRGGDELIRWGGEEFIILLGKSDAKGVRVVMERILSVGFGPRPDGKPLTASMGVAEKLADDTQSWQDLVEIADQRMYAAKTTGKDRCVLWNGEVLTKSGIIMLPDGDPAGQGGEADNAQESKAS